MFLLRDSMIKGKSLGLWPLRSKGNFYHFNLITKENQTAACQSINFAPHSSLVLLLQKTIGPTITKPLNFTRRLFFRTLKWSKKKDMQKSNTVFRA